MLNKLTGAGLPVVTCVQTAGHVKEALGGHLGSELGPLQLFHICRITLTLADEKERITVATARLEGAEGHKHGDTEVHVQDADSLWT